MQLGDDLKNDKTPKVFLGPQRILHRDAVTYVSSQLTCASHCMRFIFMLNNFAC